MSIINLEKYEKNKKGFSMNNILICNAYIMPMQGENIENGYILIENNKIKAFGSMKDVPNAENLQIIDANNGYITPGLIDIHSHIGLYEDGISFEGADGNEDTDPITPQLRVIDGINPMERAFKEALEAGVTTVVVSPGSANPIGGQLAAIKTFGRRIDDMIIKEPIGVKFAMGENPKNTYHDKNETPVTRMAIASLLRENLRKAVEYHDRKHRAFEHEEEDLPDFDAKLEILELLIDGKLPAHIHAHRADDIFTALRICKEFNIKPVLVHATEGHLIADLIAQDNVPVISGPYMTDRSKPELVNLTESSPAIMQKAGVKTAISTDHPEMPVKYILIAAAVAVKNGMDEMEALRAITIRGAEIVGLDDKIGSIAEGKDADLVVFSGHPLDFRSKVQAVLLDGKPVYRRNEK